MNTLLNLAIHNTLFTAALAICVFWVCRLMRNPPTAHVLWLLVLIKLVTPPIVDLPIPEFGWTKSSYYVAMMDVSSNDSEISERGSSEAQPVGPKRTEPNEAWRSFGSILFWVWLIGAAILVFATVYRVILFEKLLKGTLPASHRVQEMTAQVASRIGVRRVPNVRYVQSIRIPMVWCAWGAPRVLLPMEMVQHGNEREVELIVAHELAHLRRRDHWVRFFEVAVTILYWWNPLASLVRRQLHEAEDQCCDAWVRQAIPHQTTEYAEVVLQLAQSLKRSHLPWSLLPSSLFLRSVSLKGRIEMILEGRFAPKTSRTGTAFACLIAMVVLPASINTAWGEPKVVGKSNSEAFPHVVPFEQGVIKFEDGDEITITEIRGTAEAFEPGNIYHITGTYKLNSQDDATLAAYTTAKHAKDGTSMSWKVQTMRVTRGEGRFSLMLPMSYEGWPHLSFYRNDTGNGFGGNYFGTGESVLKKWWGE